MSVKAEFIELSILEKSGEVLSFLLLNSFYSALLAISVLVLRLLYRGLPKNIEYGLWCIVLLRLVMPIDLSFDYAIPGILRDWLMDGGGASFYGLSFNSQLFSLSQNSLVSQSVSIEWIFIAWLSIVALVFLRYLMLRVQLLKMINRSSPIVEYPIVACANRWRLNFWIKRPVHVIAEDKYLSPFTFFFKSPIIFIPRKILETNDEKLIESIIAHEMAHVKRRDSLWLVIQNLIQIVYFFNPIVWVVVRRLSSLRENLCDEMVLSAKQIQPEDYGKSLLKVLRFNISGEFTTALSNAFLGYKGQIKQRIETIGNFSRPLRYSKLQSITVGFLAILLLPFLSAPPIEATQQKIVKKRDPFSPFPEHIRKQVRLPVVPSED